MAQLTIDDVLNSKVYMKENSQISFGSPRQYIEPFMERLKDLNPTYKVSISDRVANKDEETDKINEAFGRVLIEAKLPEQYTVESHDTVCGLVYALDTQKPNIKVYSGHNAWACTNLSIFGARYIHTVEILQGTSSIYEKIAEYVEGITEQTRKFKEIHDAMNSKFYENEEIDRVIGKLLINSYKNKSIGTTPILSAMKDLLDPKSVYSIRENKTSQWNIYSAMTQYVTDKVDIVDKSLKSVAISNLFITSN